MPDAAKAMDINNTHVDLGHIHKRAVRETAHSGGSQADQTCLQTKASYVQNQLPRSPLNLDYIVPIESKKNTL